MSAPASVFAFSVTNRADWVQPVQVNDALTPFDLIDLTGAEINVRITDASGCEKLSATVGDGIEITGTGVFEFTFDDSEMATLCAGTYQIGSIYRLNGETNDVFIGTVTITENPGRLA